jgi:glycosyltransferase involved in cell wall biosynthesis
MLDRPLYIAGSGRDRERLEAMAGPNITFLGYVPDENLPDLISRSRAFLFPGEEDFGIAPIQAMAAGRPVIAYAGGGALETVIHGETGWLFTEQSVPAIIEAVASFDPDSVDVDFIVNHAAQYDVAVFKQKMALFVEEKMSAEKRPFLAD